MSKKIQVLAALAIASAIWVGMRGRARLTSEDLMLGLERLENLSIKSGQRVYAGDALFEYINGGADPYHAYGFVRVVTEELKFTDNGETVIVDIYDMGTPDNAFGIFSFFRLEKADFPEIGTACQFYAPTLDMCKGRFLVQLAASTPFNGHRERLIDIVKHIDAGVPGKSGLPAMLQLLPSENRIPHTEKYVRNSVFGFDFLQNAWSADYKLDDETVTLTIVPFESDKEASAKLGKFMESSRAENITDKGSYYIAKQPYRGLFIAGTNGRHLVHASGSEKPGVLEKIFGVMSRSTLP